MFHIGETMAISYIVFFHSNGHDRNSDQNHDHGMTAYSRQSTADGVSSFIDKNAELGSTHRLEFILTCVRPGEDPFVR